MNNNAVDADANASNEPNIVDSDAVDADADASNQLKIVDSIDNGLNSTEKDKIVACEFVTLHYHY